jgi:tRNA threonylcarbamoyladenosine biosynthesis protein TsaE
VTARRDICDFSDGSQQRIGRVHTCGPAETEALGARIAGALRPGDVVLVAGELGAGKTTLVRGACRELGVTVPVTSPTFTIGQQYPAPVPVSHVDLFRVDGLAEEEPELLADYLGPDTIAFVEWPPSGPSELAGLGQIVRRVRIEHAGGDSRLVVIE